MIRRTLLASIKPGDPADRRTHPHGSSAPDPTLASILTTPTEPLGHAEKPPEN